MQRAVAQHVQSTGPAQVIGAFFDFRRNHREMIEANTIGADKFFHCKANCEAAQRGPVGEMSAPIFSELRELTDVIRKGDSQEEVQADRDANNYGREQGAQNPHGSCPELCAKYRPRGMDQ